MPKRKAPSALKAVRNWLTARLQRPDACFGTSTAEPYSELESIVQSVIQEKQNNTVLLVGAYGSGKSACLARLFSELRARPERSDGRPPFLLVKLDGSLFKTDVEAVRELSRQLSIDFETRADGAHTTSSIDQHISYIVSTMQEGKLANLPVFIVLDDFEAFTKRTKQTLLYNLFDLTQTASVQIAIIGLTPRLDVVDLLEKRLKSRFSHRQVLFLHPSPDEFVESARAMLSISEEEVEDAGLSQAVSEEWNAAMEELFAPTGPLQKMLRRQARAGQSLRWLTRVMSIVLAQPSHIERGEAGGRRGVPDARTFMDAADMVAVSIKPTMLNGLPLAETVVLVACGRLAMRSEDATINFELAFREYTDFERKSAGVMASMARLHHSVAIKAFERLIEIGLLRWEEPASMKKQAQFVVRSYQPVVFALDPEAVLQHIASSAFACPTDIGRWAASDFE